jgi:hypothetical protein
MKRTPEYVEQSGLFGMKAAEDSRFSPVWDATENNNHML